MNQREKIILIACVLLLGTLFYWGAIWFFDNHVRLSREVRTGQSPPVRHNPLLATERFLNLFGWQAQSISGREHMLQPPDDKGLFIIYHLGPGLPEANEDAWIEWMQQGGRMILTPEITNTDDDDIQLNHIYSRFKVRLYQIKATQVDQKNHGIQTLRFPGQNELVNIRFDPRLVLEDKDGRADLSIQGDQGAHLLYLPVGRGGMVVLSENTFLTNDHIGEHDHAWLLAALARPSEVVWLLYRSEMPALMVLIWRIAPWLVISLILLLVLALWRFGFKTGPLLPQSDRSRRDLLEHLLARAAWAWRIEKGQTMLDANKKVLEQRWLQRHTGLNAMGPDARCAWIAKQCGLTKEKVKLAIYGEIDDDQALIMHSAAQRSLFIELHKTRHSSGSLKSEKGIKR